MKHEPPGELRGPGALSRGYLISLGKIITPARFGGSALLMGFSMAKHVVLERLNKLVAKGYVVRWEESEQDTVRLQHPRAPDLTLFSDGRIWVLTVSPDDWIAAENEADQRRFQPFVSPNDWIAAENEADQRRFKTFVRRIPKPTTLQSLKATCHGVDCRHRSLSDGSGITC